jgi:hypothetical protein
VDWGKYSGWIEYIQKGMYNINEIFFQYSELTRLQMWVSIDDWHENPDIIHTKFT